MATPSFVASPWLVSALYIALAVAAGIGTYALLAAILRSMRKPPTEAANVPNASGGTWNNALLRFLDPALPLAGAVFVFASAARAAAGRIGAEAQAWVAGITVVAWGALAASAVMRLVQALAELHASRHPQRRPMLQAGRRAATGIVWGIAALVVLGSLGIEITPIVASLGIGGIAIALALQDSLRNFFAGLWIRSTRDIRSGHFIRIEDAKVEGNIERMGWRTTRIRTRARNLQVVPNDVLARSVVTNYHLPDPRTVLEIEVGTAFDADPEQVRDILVQAALHAADEVQGILGDPKPTARLSMGVKGLRWTLKFHLVDISLRNVARDLVLRHAIRDFQAAGVRMSEI